VSLDHLAELGREPNGGITRTAWSAELSDAYAWVGGRLQELGLAVETDAAGNLLAKWTAGSGRPVLVGSHLDTVPCGGRFDGALGVVAAVHAVQVLKAERFEPERPLWVIAFMDEEGTRFDAALFGSRAFTGEDVTRFADRPDASGTTLREAMADAGHDVERAREADRAAEIGAYLELHIEQGPVLEAEGIEIGVVTSIVGLRGFRVGLSGRANHAGTTPMAHRRDALLGAARIAVELRDAARSRDAVTATVGRLIVAPGGANVIPGRADFTIDVRATTSSGLRELERLVEETVARVAAEEGLEADLQPTFSLDPLELDPTLADLLERAADAEGATARRMPSGAGHDAMLVGRRAPAAMIFVPSRGGVSHSPEEYTTPEHVELGVRVLTAALRELLGKEVR
jgi:allantoate deiminase